MTSANRYPKISGNIFYEQFKWSIWFLAFLFLAHLLYLIFLNNGESAIAGFFAFSNDSVNIFMLVCGIIAPYAFLDYHVQQGISRKEWYSGTAIAAFLLALAVTLLPLLINGIEHVLAQLGTFSVELNSASVFSTAGGWSSVIAAFFFNALAYYLIGLLIGVGYYRFGWLIGFGFVALAILAASINGYLWGDNSLSSSTAWILTNPVNPSTAFAVIGSLMLIAVLLISIRLLTKRIRIRL